MTGSVIRTPGYRQSKLYGENLFTSHAFLVKIIDKHSLFSSAGILELENVL